MEYRSSTQRLTLLATITLLASGCGDYDNAGTSGARYGRAETPPGVSADRATEIAQRVEGVGSVSDRLVVQPA
jgi:hypothetical protein